MSLLSTLHGVSSTIFSNLFVTLPYPESAPGLSDQTVIVTGSNTGLGFEASRHLLRLGVGRLIMAVRSLEKGERARAELLRSTGRAADCVEVWHLDMESYASVKAFASRASTALARVDAVLANAGILTTRFSLAEDGDERTLAVNVVGVFLLLLLLLPKLRESPSPPGRFVIPNSAMHYWAPIRELVPQTSSSRSSSGSSGSSAKSSSILSRLNDPDSAHMAARYQVSKLLVLYATRQLALQTAESGKGPVAINTPNPSYCKSGLASEPGLAAPPDFVARSTEMGSRALVHGIMSGPESSGQYLTNCHIQTPASHVTNKTGALVQKAFFRELLEKLESISPGISRNI